jgi:hypothetical protein
MNSVRSKLTFRDAVVDAAVFAIPFLLFLSAYGVFTDRLQLSSWPPQVDMGFVFGTPLYFCATLYLYVLLNIFEIRRGRWNWSHGLISAAIIIIVAAILWPAYEPSLGREEYRKLGVKFRHRS